MGGWDWDRVNNLYFWDEGQKRIFGVDMDFSVTAENIRSLIYPDDLTALDQAWDNLLNNEARFQIEYRVRRPTGEIRWCLASAAATREDGEVVRVSGVTIDITERKAAEERPNIAVPRSRSSRQECARACAVHRSAHAPGGSGRLHARDRGAYFGAVARAHRIVAVTLARR
jgi:PAS domain S-box-containing protein